MAFTVSFVPNTGNKYFLAAADENLRLYDFEHATVSSHSFLYLDVLETIHPLTFFLSIVIRQ